MRSGVLFVCHANICRSPLAEHIAAMMLARALGTGRLTVPTASAGTHARDGLAMHPHAAAVLAERGADPTPFRSRTLTATAVLSAGLVLAAGRRERAACLELAPGAVRRAFTLRQFARLSDAVTSRDLLDLGLGERMDPLDAVVAATTRARGRLQPVEPGEDDLGDPVGEELPAFQRCAATIEAALEPLARLISVCR
jgi:protein-tyrosine phosphatase